MTSLANDIRFALRSLLRAPAFTLVAVLTLALGLGANTAVFSVLESVLLRPLPYADSEQLVFIANQYPELGVNRGAQSPGDFADYREQTTLFEDIAALGGWPQTLRGVGHPVRVDQAVASTNFFAMLGVTPYKGRLFEEGDQGTVSGPTVVILSHAFWQGRFGGDPDIVGKQFQFNQQTKTVIGVLPPGFRLLLPAQVSLATPFQAWTPLPREWMGKDGKDRSAHWMRTYARLEPGVSLLEAQSEMDAVAARQREAIARRAERQAQIGVLPLHGAVTGDVSSMLLLLQGAVLLVLLIVCANVANLFLVRARGRTREVCIRLALGSGRLGIIRQLLVEGLMLALAGAALGGLLAYWSVPLLLSLKPVELPQVGQVGLNPAVLGFVLAASLLTALLFGLAPAWTSTRVSQSEVLHGGRAVSGGRGWHWRLLVVGEVALTLVLLAGAGLLLGSLLQLTRVDPGFEYRNVLAFTVPLPQEYFGADRRKRGQFMRGLEERLEAMPGVEGASHVFPLPLGEQMRGAVVKTEQEVADNAQGRLAQYRMMTPGFLGAFAVSLLQGRSITQEDGKDKLIIDRRLAEELWPGQSPLGRKMEVSWWSGPVLGEVVGVVENLRSAKPDEDDPPTLYLQGRDWSFTSMTTLVRASGDPAELLPQIRALVSELDDRAPVEGVTTLEAQLADRLAVNRFAAALIAVFAAAALVLSLIGLYGVLTSLVRMRLPEFGVRMAFGAGRPQILRLVLRQGLTLTLLGLLIGTLSALALTRFLAAFLYNTTPTDPLTLSLSALLLALISTAATLLPAHRASRLDPAKTLRAE